MRMNKVGSALRFDGDEGNDDSLPARHKAYACGDDQIHTSSCQLHTVIRTIARNILIAR